MTLKIAIAGAAGRMGQALAKSAGLDFRVVGGSERPNSVMLGEALGQGVVSADVAKAAADADVWLDFTSPPATLAALDALKSTGVRAVVIGTTGFVPNDEKAIAAHAERLAIVKAGNYSLGVNLLLAMVEKAAAALGPEWDIEISETHHRHKVDAPSGTGLMLGEAAARGRGKPLTELWSKPYETTVGARKPGSIGFVVSRAGGVIGDHEARFASEQEVLTLGHRAIDRAIFANGALHAAKWAAAQKPGLYSMRDVLAL